MRALLLLLGLLLAGPAFADAPPGARFVTLRFDEANGRAGPSTDHPVRWVYRRAGLPLEVLAESGDWRRVRDPGGEIVWIHARLLSERRAVYTREETLLRAQPNLSAQAVAIAEPGAILTLEACQPGWRRIAAQGFRGWAPEGALWGVAPGGCPENAP